MKFKCIFLLRWKCGKTIGNNAFKSCLKISYVSNIANASTYLHNIYVSDNIVVKSNRLKNTILDANNYWRKV